VGVLNSEADVVERVEWWLRHQGYETRLELQWRPLASTDLVGWRGTEFVAVECKVRDWVKALAQAIPQGKAFNSVYIAGVYSPSSKQLKALLEDDCPWSNYVGVLGVTEHRVEILRPAAPLPGWPTSQHRNIVGVQFFTTERDAQKPFRPARFCRPQVVSP